jgi:hypothetical protein
MDVLDLADGYPALIALIQEGWPDARIDIASALEQALGSCGTGRPKKGCTACFESGISGFREEDSAPITCHYLFHHLDKGRETWTNEDARPETSSTLSEAMTWPDARHAVRWAARVGFPDLTTLERGDRRYALESELGEFITPKGFYLLEARRK